MSSNNIIQTKKNKLEKKTKTKSNDNFKLFNDLEFMQDNDFFDNVLKQNVNHKNKKSEKQLKKNTINNEKNNQIQKKMKNKKSIKITKFSNQLSSLNPIIKNEVIWYSDELDSEQLELKFKNKSNNKKSNFDNDFVDNTVDTLNNMQNEIILNSDELDSEQLELKFKNKYNKKQSEYNDELIEKNIYPSINEEPDWNNSLTTEKSINKFKIYSYTENVEEYFTSRPEVTLVKKSYRRFIDSKKCILKSKKIDSNVFQLDLSCDQNCSSFKLFNNSFASSHVGNFNFVLDNKTYNPEVVEVYLNNILVKKNYSDIINNLSDKYGEIKPYTIVEPTYPLTPNTKIMIKIIDPNQIDDVYFNVVLEKIDSKITKSAYITELNPMEFISSTHELLYEGIESDIIINNEYGYYSDIYFVCENILENISTITMCNTDVVLFENVLPILLDYNNNLILYTLNVGGNYMSGIKIDGNNFLKIKLNKLNPDSKVKVYGNKLFIIRK